MSIKPIIYGVLLGTYLSGAFITAEALNGKFSTSLNNQVQYHQTTLKPKQDKTLQDNTSTAPASDPISVPEVSTPVAVNAATAAPVASESAPTPTTKTITKAWYNYSFDVFGNESATCYYEYSDGSNSSEPGEIIGTTTNNPDGTTTHGTQVVCKPVGTVVSL